MQVDIKELRQWIEPIPPCGHRLYCLPAHRQSEIGAEGLARRGGFQPPVAYMPDAWVLRFSFRAVKPVFDVAPGLRGGRGEDGNSGHLWVQDIDAALCMDATAVVGPSAERSVHGRGNLS